MSGKGARVRRRRKRRDKHGLPYYECIGDVSSGSDEDMCVCGHSFADHGRFDLAAFQKGCCMCKGVNPPSRECKDFTPEGPFCNICGQPLGAPRHMEAHFSSIVLDGGLDAEIAKSTKRVTHLVSVMKRLTPPGL